MLSCGRGLPAGLIGSVSPVGKHKQPGRAGRGSHYWDAMRKFPPNEAEDPEQAGQALQEPAVPAQLPHRHGFPCRNGGFFLLKRLLPPSAALMGPLNSGISA